MTPKFDSLLLCLTAALAVDAATIQLSATVPADAAPPVQSSYLSLAVEFFLFPDLAKPNSRPNILSQNLIAQITKLQNASPILRVGGTSQDHALYNASLPLGIPIIRDATSKAVQFGPGFFDAFTGLPNIDFTFGLNLAGNTSQAATSLSTVAKLVCQNLGSSLAYWELGNEPDLFTAPDSDHNFRPPTWNERNYVDEWLNKSSAVTQAVMSVSSSCPGLLNNGKLSFVAPSFFNVNGHLKPGVTWDDGLGNNQNINEITGHIYMDSQDNNAVTLQGTLMNHTRTVSEINNRMNVWDQVTQKSHTYFSFNEIGSLVPIGKKGISDVFGAALWAVDFSLHAARRGVGRLHWQQGTGFPYEAWQPVDQKNNPKGTKAPFYGLLASTAFIGDSRTNRMRTIGLPVADPVQSSSYALYRNGTLKRIAIIQMTAYSMSSGSKRPSTTFTYQLPLGFASKAIDVKWLAAAGSDAAMGITFANMTYETVDGLPVQKAAPAGSVGSFSVSAGGVLNVTVPHSSAVILQFND